MVGVSRKPPKTLPDPSDLPPDLEPGPGTVEPAASWDGVEAVAGVAVPDTVPDLEVRECRFRGVDLSGRVFTGLHCRDTAFVACDLSAAVLDGAVLNRVTFTGCRLSGTVLSGARLRDVRITDCGADLLSLRMTRASYLWVEDSTVRGADLHEFAGEDCAFLRCDLTGANLERAHLGGTALHGSVLDDVRGALALRGVRIGPDRQVTLGAALLDVLGVQVTASPDRS